MLMPYSQPSPGSKSRGVVSAAFVHVVMPGVFVAVWYRAISVRQISYP